MKKAKKVLFMIIVFFSFVLVSEARLAMCSYDEHTEIEPNNPIPEGTQSEHYAYIFSKGTKRFIILNGTDVTEYVYGKQKTDEKEKRSTFENFVRWIADMDDDDYLDLVQYDTLNFNAKYSYLYLSFNMTAHRDKIFLLAWLNKKDTARLSDFDKGVTSNDVKELFIQRGICPRYACISTKFGHTVFYNEDIDMETAKKHCDSFTNSPMNYSSGDWTFMTLRYDMMRKYYVGTSSAPSTDHAQNLSVLKRFNDDSIPKNFFNDQSQAKTDMERLTGLFTFTINGALQTERSSMVPDEIDYHTLAVMLNNNYYDTGCEGGKICGDLMINAATNIVNHADTARSYPEYKVLDNDTKQAFDDLVKAAKFYVRSYGGGTLESAVLDNDCDTIFGDPSDKDSFAHYLKVILTTIQYLGPVLVIVLVSVDYFKAMISSSKDAFEAVNKRTAIRIVLLLLLFYLPILVKFILETLGAYKNCSLK